MDSLPLPDGRTAATGEERVLLTFGGTRDRELLRSWLADEFEVVEGTPDEVRTDERVLEAYLGGQYAAAEG